jgi:nucleotide-binding universal stress UspA family protein
MTTLLVPLDGSSAGERAIAPARSLAGRLDADIVLARSSWDVSDADASRYLDSAFDRFHLNIETTKRVVFRFPPDAVADLATDYTDPLICMASSGRRGIAHAVLGSASEEVMARTSVPIVACGPEVDPEVLERLPATPRLGLCIDAGTHETPVVQFCVHWARALGASVDVLTVRAEDDRPLSRFHAATADQLADAVALLQANDVVAAAHELEELQPARRLAVHARAQHLTLLVAAKRSGAGGLARDVLGSTVVSLIHQAPCPVLLPPAQ